MWKLSIIKWTRRYLGRPGSLFPQCLFSELLYKMAMAAGSSNMAPRAQQHGYTWVRSHRFPLFSPNLSPLLRTHLPHSRHPLRASPLDVEGRKPVYKPGGGRVITLDPFCHPWMIPPWNGHIQICHLCLHCSYLHLYPSLTESLIHCHRSPTML